MKNGIKLFCIFTLLMVFAAACSRDYTVKKTYYDKNIDAYRVKYGFTGKNDPGAIVRNNDFSLVRDKEILKKILSISNIGEILSDRNNKNEKYFILYESGKYFYQALQYMTEKRFETALEMFKKAQKINRYINNRTDIEYRIGICYYKMNKIKPALEAMKRFLKFSENSTDYHFILIKVKNTHFNKLITSAKMFIKRVGAGKPFIIKDPIWPHKRGTLARLVVNPFLASNIFKNIGLENIPILPYLQLEDHTIIDSYGSIGLGIIGSLGSSTDFFLKTAGNYLAGDGEDKIFFLNSGIKWQFFNSGDNLFALTFAPLFQYRFDQHANQRFTQFSAQIAGSFHITSRLLIDGAYQQPIIRSYMGFGREDEEYFPKGINYIGITYDFSASGRYKISLRFERERIIAIYSMDYIKYGYDFTDKRFLWYLLDVNF